MTEEVWGHEEEEMPEVTLKEFDALCNELFEKKKALKEFEDEVKLLNKKVLTLMLHYKKSTYRAPSCTISVTERRTVSMPKDPEKKQQFMAYLKRQGHFDDMVSVNSRTLNAYYKAAEDSAISKGATEFSMPGLETPTTVETLSVRKK